MRFWFLFIFLPFIGFAQFTDDFSDGDFTSNPAWVGHTTKFQVNNGMLQSNGSSTSADTLVLTTPSSILDSVEWRFFMRLDFNPTSSTNYVKVYLVSDNSDLQGSLNGYFLRMGETGSSDTLELYRQSGSTETKILTGLSAFGSTTQAAIKVTRDHLGNWRLYVDPTGGSNYNYEGTVMDNTHTTSSCFGVYCKYSTTSRFDQYFFDDINIAPLTPDTDPPQLVSISVTSSTTLDVTFSEEVGQGPSENVANYSGNNGIGNPSLASRDVADFTLVHLTFSSPFGNGATNVLTVSNIEDTIGNIMAGSETGSFMYFIAEDPALYEVIINEIHSNPTPQVGLPEGEFVEIYNASSKVLNLSGYTLSDASSTGTLPGKVLIPGDHVILCATADTSIYQLFGNTIGLSSWPSLNNSGDDLTLKDNTGEVLHTVTYADTWYGGSYKEDGGWSLEMVDPTNPCGETGNWLPSEDPNGGTPGLINSVWQSNPDDQAPDLIRADALDDQNVLLTFSEKLDSVGLASLLPTISNGIAATNIAFIPSNTVQLTLYPYLVTGTEYSVTITGLYDCVGNEISNQNTAVFALPEQGQPGDVIINEILFNPSEDGYDFVEVYNNSSRYIDISNWQLANLDNGIVSNHQDLGSVARIMFPGDYLLLTKDTASILKEYPLSSQQAFMQMGSLPSYNNETGTVVLVTDQLVVSDSITYHEDMHFTLLNDISGVSLERLGFDRLTHDKSNWHSAAEGVGFATPGYLNSQYTTTKLEKEVTVEPEIFSPDNDGNNDVVNISYQFSTSGFVGTINVYDSNGRLVRTLVQNELLGTEGVFAWDGENDSQEKSRLGIYIIYFEAFGVDGEVKKYKIPCVLGSRL